MPTCLSSSEPTATRRLSAPQAKRSQTTGALSWIRCRTLACIAPLFESATAGPSRHATTPSKVADRPAPTTTDQPTCIALPLSQALLLVAQEERQQIIDHAATLGHDLGGHRHA